MVKRMRVDAVPTPVLIEIHDEKSSREGPKTCKYDTGFKQ